MGELFANFSAPCRVYVRALFYDFHRDGFLPGRAPFYGNFFNAHFLVDADYLRRAVGSGDAQDGALHESVFVFCSGLPGRALPERFFFA
jgi:hypothetical protein